MNLNQWMGLAMIAEWATLTIICTILFIIRHCSAQEIRGLHTGSPPAKKAAFWLKFQGYSAKAYLIGTITFTTMAVFTPKTINHWLVAATILMPFLILFVWSRPKTKYRKKNRNRVANPAHEPISHQAKCPTPPARTT